MRILGQDYQAPPDSRLSEKRPAPDGFDALASAVGLSGRQVTLLRASAKYLRQGGMRFSEDYVQRALRSNGAITQLLVRLFVSRFDPASQDGATARCEAIAEEIRSQLDEVYTLDHDRILRSYLELIEATLRTNYYKQDSPGGGNGTLVLKLDPAAVPELPEPRPKFEVFVYSPRLEGVHLRFGHVARGGVRWSDRWEDYRTEILGLAKAQEVKNSVIVPSGAKGGFVCRSLPDPSDREAYQHEVLRSYKTFVAAMLDVTDNLRDGQVIRRLAWSGMTATTPTWWWPPTRGPPRFPTWPTRSRRRTGTGSATPSPPAAPRATTTRSWGIAARGAWESVKFHFATPGPRPGHPPSSRWRASATCRVTSSATACCCLRTSSWSPRSITGTCSSTRRPTRR